MSAIDGTDGLRTATWVLVVASDQMTSERTRAINALTPLLRTVDLRVDARTAAQITGICGWRDQDEDVTLEAAMIRDPVYPAPAVQAETERCRTRAQPEPSRVGGLWFWLAAAAAVLGGRCV